MSRSVRIDSSEWGRGHSDHGSQFTSWAFTENVRRLGLVSSMGTIGDCFDNAPMESFWGSMQIELLDRQRWRTILELAIAIADYIEHFYNPARRHSALGYLTPNEFEVLHQANPRPRCPKKWSSEWGTGQVEPEMGFEPMTCALRVRCSTTELPGRP